MSARQNKKQRKGRNNPNNRERTVTTLTEDPNSSYLIPLSSEDPPGALMSSPFSISSSTAGNGPSSSAYQPPSSYEAYGFTDFSSHPQIFPQQVQQQQQPQQQQKPQVSPIPGKNDLERLENLKNIIKGNQHANYRPIPQPTALASLYLGPIPTSQAQSEQNQFGNTDGSSQAISTTGSSPSSPADHGRRPPRLQSKEWEISARGTSTTTNGGQPTNNVLSDSSPISAHLLTSSSSFSFSTQTNSPIQAYGGRINQANNASSAIDTSNLPGGSKTSSAGPISAGSNSIDVHMSDAQSEGSVASPRFESSGARPTPGNPDPVRVPDDRLAHVENGYGGPRGPSNIDKSSFDGKDDLPTRDSSWSMRDGPPDDRRRDLDRPLPSPRPALNGSGGSSDIRPSPNERPLIPRDPLPPRDDRFYDRDRERERERYDRDRRDWDRDRRPSYDRFRPPPDVVRRPPPEQRHYEPAYNDRGPPPRRYDIVKEEPISDSRRLADLRRPPSPMADDRPPVRSEDHRLPLSSRLPPSSVDTRAPPPVDVSRPLPDSRPPVPPLRAPSPDDRPVRTASFDDRHDKPAALSEERRRAPVPPDVRVSPSSVRPADIPGITRPADRERDVPLTPVDPPRPPISLEERISRPSLQERISSAQPDHSSQPPPPASRPEPGRPLEERLSAIPVSADSREQRGRIPDRAERPPPPQSRPPQPMDDRVAPRPPPPSVSTQDNRRIDDRPGRYTRGMSPSGDRSTYNPPPARDEAVNKGPPSPRSGARDYRPPPPRPISRERTTTSYRPDDRNYIPDDRRTGAMDVDTPSRYSDSRSIPYNRPFSPPSVADLARDRARAAQYPPSPSRPPHDSHSYDDDRRYPPSRDWATSYQSSYSDRRREWSTADEEYYKSRQWDRNPPLPPAASASERDRYERDPPPPVVRNSGWETRDERERRDYPPPRAPSPSRSYDGPPRSLSSRLTDTYSSSPGATSGDRSYTPRDAPPSFSRVRQRSVSPTRRPGAVLDDNRPPAKRTRDDGYGTGEYYPPSSAASTRDAVPPIRRQDNYPSLSRGASPSTPSAGGGAYFDNRGPPPSATSAASGGDRDYPPRDYTVQSYERPRSPPRGAAYSRGGYARDTRDDRRYPPPPPPSSMLPPRRP